MQIPVQIRLARWRVPTQFSRSYLLADGTGLTYIFPKLDPPWVTLCGYRTEMACG
jgi:hypothetical protein